MQPDSSLSWSTYPALLLAGVFGCGVVVHRVLGPGFWVWSSTLVVGLLGHVAARSWDRRTMVSLAPLARMMTVLVIGFCLGGARYALFQQPSPRSVDRIASFGSERDVWVQGVVEDSPERTDSSSRFTLAVDSLGRSPAVPADGMVRVTMRPPRWDDQTGSFPRLYQGDHVRLSGTLRPPRGQRNPGGFDYAAYLARRGVCCTSFVSDPGDVVVLHRNRGLVDGLVVEARTLIRHQIARFVPGDDARAVLQALLLGDRSRIRDSIEDQFKATGLMHLLAVSGLHVFLVGMVLYVLLRPILMRFRFQWRSVEMARAAVTVLVLGLYVLLTGSRPSVVRSAVMATLFIGGILFQRSSHPLNTLGVAALLLLAVRPPAVFDVGFQLSMAAVAALVAVHPRLMDWLPESWTERTGLDWLVTTVSTSAAATIGAAPVLLFHFGWVSGAGLLLNLVGIPCTGIAMTAAVAMVTFGGLWSVAGAAFGSMADLAVKGLLFASRAGAEWFGSWGLRIADPSGWILGALVAGTIAVAQWPRPRHRWRCLVCGLLLLTAGLWSETLGADAEPTLDLIFFDVGQGDAILMTTPNDRRMLVDTGPRPAPGDAVALNSVLPYLRQRGVEHLETVVISHPDEDHLGGLPAILREMRVGRVIHSGQRVNTDLFAETRRLLRETSTATDTARRGEVVQVGPSVKAQVLSPPSRPSLYGIEGENDKSVVLRLVYGGVDVLLPGDIERSAEKTLVRAYGRQLRSRIVKIPHHGSTTSSSREFVRQVVSPSKSTDAVVSVGRFNQFGMPDSTIMKRWRSEGATVSSTARSGAVWLRTDGSAVWEVGWQ